MLSPLHPLSSSRPLREGRRVPNSDFVSASVRLLLVGARLTPAADLYSTARHEAGHAIAAHAVGRRVVALRCTRKELAADDPINPYEVPFMTYGFHQSEPLRGAEVQECLREGARLPAELQHWCLQDAVICWPVRSLKESLVRRGVDTTLLSGRSPRSHWVNRAGRALGSTTRQLRWRGRSSKTSMRTSACSSFV